jgi:hypothetical protein
MTEGQPPRPGRWVSAVRYARAIGQQEASRESLNGVRLV